MIRWRCAAGAHTHHQKSNVKLACVLAIRSHFLSWFIHSPNHNNLFQVAAFFSLPFLFHLSCVELFYLVLAFQFNFSRFTQTLAFIRNSVHSSFNVVVFFFFFSHFTSMSVVRALVPAQNHSLLLLYRELQMPCLNFSFGFGENLFKVWHHQLTINSYIAIESSKSAC